MTGKIKYSEETQIDMPTGREGFFVEKCDWERIKRLLGKIGVDSNRWENASWFAAASDIAFLIATATTPLKIEFSIAFGFSLIITVIFFIVAYKINKTKGIPKEEIFLEITKMEEKVNRQG